MKANDAFGHQDFAIALRSLIESEHNQPPYSIGLLGPWGTGKSTIKSLYLKDLQDDATTYSRRKKRSQRIKAITFNAWRYGGSSDIKRTLLRHVFLELWGSDQTLKDELYNQIKSTFPRPGTWKDIWFEVYEKGVWNLIPVSVFLIILFPMELITKFGLGVNDPTQWIFHGHPCGSVIRDEEKKWTVHGPLEKRAWQRCGIGPVVPPRHTIWG